MKNEQEKKAVDSNDSFASKSPTDVKQKHSVESEDFRNRLHPKGYTPHLSNQKQAAKKLAIKRNVPPAAINSGLNPVTIDQKLETNEGEEILETAASADSVHAGVDVVINYFKRRRMFGFIIFGGGIFFLILLMLITVVSKYSDSLAYVSGETLEEYKVLYEKVDSVVSEMQSEYGVTVDRFLIISALTSLQNNDAYSDANDKSIDVESTNSDGILETISESDLENKVKLLAKYQIITNSSCSTDTSTMRKIAANDDDGLLDFWKSSVNSEKNYDCNGKSGYTLSTEEGKINDDSSGSAFYWNLVDEDFLKEYYSDSFKNVDDAGYEKKAAEYIEFIYDYAEVLKDLGDCSNTSTSFETTNVSCDKITVVGQNAGTYNLEEYVAGVVAHEASPSYMASIAGVSASSLGMQEATKVYAILARTYAIKRTNHCQAPIQNSQSAQTFKPTEDANIWKAVNDTQGVVITLNDDVISSQYDSFGKDRCDSDFCYATYRRVPSQTETHLVKVPASWSNFFQAGTHHNGSSQLGVLYEATGENKDFQTIINGSYQTGIKLKSLSGTSNNQSAYCERQLNQAGSCDGTTNYGLKSVGSTSLKSEMQLLSCMADDAEKAFKTISDACGRIPHDGSLRNLTAQVNEARSSTSFHYTGRAFDLATQEGMQSKDTYFYVTLDDTNSSTNYYRLYCRTNKTGNYISNKTITPIRFKSGSGYVKKSSVTGNFLDVTKVFNDNGIYGITPRSCYKRNSLCLEWWHFQDTSGLVKGQTTFRRALNQRFGNNYNYSNTPVYSHLNKRWNGGSFS